MRLVELLIVDVVLLIAILLGYFGRRELIALNQRRIGYQGDPNDIEGRLEAGCGFYVPFGGTIVMFLGVLGATIARMIDRWG